ncbi:hypothetical protein PHLGIDRAFT_272844 [Phlebiopsis gigantea 11061_1 CR5-6]|uniref:Uncharacterized protein n=1 Tax=Phlebiopsis gigantea (strain 11061_1 CR5-6) TaxID=745531 RepID=A0A0C3SDZ8_PHLG1|nr:hypothetical protein PHLGIDRAFT_272844 [Phlebiopsis gigantea 11061_1 CR5-6]
MWASTRQRRNYLDSSTDKTIPWVKPKTRESEPQDELKEQHCVRCHSSFLDIDDSKCEVPHVWEDAPSERYCDEVVFYSACCGETAALRMSFDGKPLNDPEPCHRGTHALNPRDVKYNHLSVNPCKADSQGDCGRRIPHDPVAPVFCAKLYGESHQSRLARRLVPELFGESQACANSIAILAWQGRVSACA